MGVVLSALRLTIFGETHCLFKAGIANVIVYPNYPVVQYNNIPLTNEYIYFR